MESKKCKTCGNDFQRPKDYSAAQWARRQFCSPQCVRGPLKKLGPRTRYRKLHLPDGRTVNTHRHLVEQALGRPLGPTEHVHHRNGDKEDNRLENLEVIDEATHGRLDVLLTVGNRLALGAAGLGRFTLRTESTAHDQ